GLEASADVTARDIACGDEESRFTLVVPGASIGVRLPLPGRHNIANALAASSIALALGVPLDTIAAALSEAEPVKGRLVRHRLANGAMLIDDSYNANPGSLNAAIDTLAAAAGESWLVLGDMRELGGEAGALHAEAGRRARRAGIARVYAIGPLSRAAAEAFGEGGRHFQNHGALVDALRVDLHAGVRVLVKGSRGSATDRVVDALLPETGGHDAAWTRALAAATRRPVRPVRLPDLPRHPRRADRAVPVAVVGPGGDPQARPVQGRPADPPGRPAVAFLQGRHPDHGRRADPVHGHRRGAAVGRPAQQVRVGGAAGDAGLRCDRLVCRLDPD